MGCEGGVRLADGVGPPARVNEHRLHLCDCLCRQDEIKELEHQLAKLGV